MENQEFIQSSQPPKEALKSNPEPLITNSALTNEIQPQIPQTNDLNNKIAPKRGKKHTYNNKVHGNRWTVVNKVAIKALQHADISLRDAALISGMSKSNVKYVWDDPELSDLSPNVVGQVKKGLGGLFYKRALGATLAISEQKLSESSALQLATVAGIMTEKGRLMEGLSTENLSFRGVTQSIEEDRAKLMKRMEELESK